MASALRPMLQQHAPVSSRKMLGAARCIAGWQCSERERASLLRFRPTKARVPAAASIPSRSAAPELGTARQTPYKKSLFDEQMEALIATDDTVKQAASSTDVRGSEALQSLRGASLVKIADLDMPQIAAIMRTASEMQDLVLRAGGDDSLKGKLLASVFYEPSTRTSCSFQAAMQRLGGGVISVEEASSSAQKGETLSDTMRCLESYCDAVVLRHPRAGAAAEAASALTGPLINAGDGVGEHPTQALLDLFTVLHETAGHQAGTYDSPESIAEALRGKVVTMVGDLKNGRTVHSLARLLGRFDVRLRYVSPANLRMPEQVVNDASRSGCEYSEHDGLSESLLQESDILYVTRVQRERFESLEDYEAVKDAFIITPETLEKMKPSARVLHPLPRVNEIDALCDNDPRAAYFRQMANGMYVRMALLRIILG